MADYKPIFGEADAELQFIKIAKQHLPGQSLDYRTGYADALGTLRANLENLELEMGRIHLLINELSALCHNGDAKRVGGK